MEERKGKAVMEKKILFMTGDYGLKSDERYDFSNSISDTTHHQFVFCNYKKVNGHEEPNNSFEAIVSTEILFKILKDAGLLIKKVGV